MITAEQITNLKVGQVIGNEQGEIEIVEIPEWDGKGCAKMRVKYIKNGSGEEMVDVAAIEGMIEARHVSILR